ncbi:MAG: endonuclease [Kutzneria sp.]|nr:endonuclease [Kutzneria sp.]MBV9847791.1 endonuclease [Kutzneria sp.]
MSLEVLLARYGTTYCTQAGIRLRDKPSPLYQLLVLALLLSTRIRADTAVKAARELYAAGWRTPRAMRDSTWQQRVDALGRGGYVRYDESTATRLYQGAELLLDTWAGDLRRLRGDRETVRRQLKRFPGIGDVGADIFCREAQAVWPELRPYFDQRALSGARLCDLPADPNRLASLVPPEQMATLSAALVRASVTRGGSHRSAAHPR